MVSVAKKTVTNVNLNRFTYPVAANAIEIANGIPYAEFMAIINELANDLVKKIIPEATLARRKKAGFVKNNEAEIAIRLLRIKKRAIEIFGDETSTQEFLSLRHPMLEMKTPVEMALKGESGGMVVENLLGKISAGVAA